jgi:glyoxylase-like metal-dependent hydrolase (beta-lactamase superfamily II)
MAAKEPEFLEEVSPGLFLVHAPREGHIPYAHSALVAGEKDILIDTGLGDELLGRLRRARNIGLVLNSHYHRDHNSGNWQFKGVPVKIHRLDVPMLNSLGTYFRMMGVTGRKDAAEIRKFTLEFIPHVRGPKAGTFEDGDVFRSGGPRVEVVHLPGHSPGHCGFFEPRSRVLFSADICPDSFGPWYGHACASMEDFAASIDRIIALDPKVLLTAHTPPLTANIAADLRRYKARIAERDRTILALLARPRTVDELLEAHPIYGSFGGALKLPFRFWEEVMIQKHLDRLVGKGAVRRAGRRFADAGTKDAAL